MAPKKTVVLFAWMDPLNPRAGGDVRYLSEMGTRLARDNYEVLWVSSKFNGAPRSSSFNGFRIERRGSLFSVFLAHHLDRDIRSLVRRAHTVETISSIPFFLRDSPSAKRYSIVHHVVPFNQIVEKVGPVAPLVYVIDRFITPRFYRTRTVLVPGVGTQEDVRHLGYKDVRLIIEGSDSFTIDFSNKEPLIVAPGPVKPWKHHEQIVMAFSCLSPPWRLVIFGSYESPRVERNLRKLVEELRLEDRVELLGYLSDTRRNQLLEKASVAIFASEKEGWCLAAMESQAHGCAIVGFNVQGLRECVIDGETGVLVDLRDPKELAAALKSVCGNRLQRERLGRAGIERSRHFDWEAAFQTFRRALNL
jgi:glycosyltransferase involved in cell wall biosynthesis